MDNHSALHVQQFGRGTRPPKPPKRKPLSTRRAREFRDRASKRMFGDREKRAARFALILAAIRANPHLLKTAPAWVARTLKRRNVK